MARTHLQSSVIPVCVRGGLFWPPTEKPCSQLETGDNDGNEVEQSNCEPVPIVHCAQNIN